MSRPSHPPSCDQPNNIWLWSDCQLRPSEKANLYRCYLVGLWSVFLCFISWFTHWWAGYRIFNFPWEQKCIVPNKRISEGQDSGWMFVRPWRRVGTVQLLNLHKKECQKLDATFLAFFRISF
jgi:hypothetical protein